MGYGLDGQGSISGRGKIFLFSAASRPDLGPTQLPIQWVPGALSPGLKQPGREADHSHPSSAEVKNDAIIYPLPHTSSWRSNYCIEHRDNFIYSSYVFHLPTHQNTQCCKSEDYNNKCTPFNTPNIIPVNLTVWVCRTERILWWIECSYVCIKYENAMCASRPTWCANVVKLWRQLTGGRKF
jgi:hypothetical protein